MPTIFISYRRDDAAGYAGRLHEALGDRYGREILFRDVDTLAPGEDFVSGIADRLRSCRVFLALIGREWLDARDAAGRRRLDQPDDYVRLEIKAALAQPHVRIIPVLIEGAAMPPAGLLPEDIRPLTRRHAISLRDDAWNHDVDRLATAITGAGGGAATVTGPGATPAASGSAPDHEGIRLALDQARRRPKLAAGVLIAIVGLLWLWGRGNDEVTPETQADAPVAARSNSSSRDGVTPPGEVRAPEGPARTGGEYAIAIPPIAEAVHGSLVYTLLSASVAPVDGTSSQVRIRMRFTNSGRYDANTWDASFRLLAGDRTFVPDSGLNELARSNSVSDGVVSFRIPAGTPSAVLRILTEPVAELPLNLSPSGQPVLSARAGTSGALAHATVRDLITERRTLVDTAEWSLTLERASSRRFVNALRLRLALRMTNRGAYPGAFPTLRVAGGGRVLPPVESQAGVVQPHSDGDGMFEFDLPPDTTRAVLRVLAPDPMAELEMNLE